MFKQLLTFLFFCCSIIAVAQIELVPNPADINSGTLTLKYGEIGDYSIFDPQSDPNLYLYTGLQTDADPLTWDYHDDFADINTLIPLTYDNTLGYYVATFNPATRTYLEEPSLNVVNIPAGTQVFDWYFLIRNADGSSQSVDLKGSDYGFGASTLSVKEFNLNESITAYNGIIEIKKTGNYTIEVFDILGKRIMSLEESVTQRKTINLQLKNGVYIVRIFSGSTTSTLKMLKY